MQHSQKAIRKGLFPIIAIYAFLSIDDIASIKANNAKMTVKKEKMLVFDKLSLFDFVNVPSIPNLITPEIPISTMNERAVLEE